MCAGADVRTVTDAEISARSVVTSRHEREERVARPIGINSAKGRSRGPRKVEGSKRGENVSRATASVTNPAMKRAMARVTRKSSVLHANPGRRRSRAQRPTRCQPSPNRNRARSRKVNTPKVAGVGVAAAAAGSAENVMTKESHVHRAASGASVDPRLLT